jgi:solute carrier family 35 protein F5
MNIRFISSILTFNQIFISFLGVLLVSLSDSSTEVVDVPSVSARAIAMFARDVAGHAPKPLLGDMWALLSAVFYSFYVILFKVKVGSESRVNMQLFFGFVGIFNVLTCWPMGLILHFAGVERLELPVGGKEWAAVIVNVSAHSLTRILL